MRTYIVFAVHVPYAGLGSCFVDAVQFRGEQDLRRLPASRFIEKRVRARNKGEAIAKSGLRCSREED